MVFQRPNPFPKSIYDNVAFGPRLNGYKGDMTALVEKSLVQADLTHTPPRYRMLDTTRHCAAERLPVSRRQQHIVRELGGKC